MRQQVSKLMMRQKSGVIINMASVGGIETNAGYLAYGSSKAALIWATRCVSKELAPYGIRVNAVAPGLTKTEMGLYKPEEELNKTIGQTALKRMADVSEITNAILFLASEKASFITGHILSVDGGRP
ncbi:MAG: SDR family oxidoreductase [Alphaproteobacteria bacterium]|nr:SDR family oxidoreductase [Alphaproteobacteria bacterium]